MTEIEASYQLSNGVSIPKLGFGTFQISAIETEAAVTMALNNNYRHIDTARNYENEKEVGQAIQKAKLKRSEIFVTTKLPAETKTYAGTFQDFDKSMKALKLDYIDLYLIHAPEPWDEAGADYDQANREVWRAMEEIYRFGKAKAIGVSNFDVHDLKNIFETAEVKPMVNQIQYYIGYTQSEITSFCKTNQILVEAYTPLARGVLAKNQFVQEMADKYGVNFAQLALEYCLQNGTLPLAKATKESHVISNTQLDFTISSSDMEKLNQVEDHSGIWHFNK